MRNQQKKVVGKNESVGARRGLAFFKLNEKAGQGFRMVVAWCMQWEVEFPTITRPRVMAVLLFAIASCALLQYLLTSEGLVGGPTMPDCLCSAADSGSSFHQPDTAIVYLDRPQRPFHGNHWFHMGEYYLSRRKIIHKKVRGTTFKHIKIIAQNHKLTGPMTKMAFSVLVLACLGEQHEDSIESIELFAPKTATLDGIIPSSRTPETRLGSSAPQRIQEGSTVQFASQAGPIFGYYATIGSPEGRFVDYRSLEQSTQERRRSKANKRQRDSLTVYEADTTDSRVGTGELELPGGTEGGGSGETEGLVHRGNKAEPGTGSNPRHWGWTRPFQTYTSDATSRSSRRRCSCGIYVGSVGPAPVSTTAWFANTTDANNLRHTALAMCDIHAKYAYSSERAVASGTRGTEPIVMVPEPVTAFDTASASDLRVLRLLIYQRDLNRRFIDLPSLKAQLNNRGLIIHGQPRQVRWEVTVLRHSEQLSPCNVIQALNQADIFLTAHGFQSTGLMFMKPGAVLIEIFPYKYHRTTYMPLAARFGLHYRSIQNPAPLEGSGGMLQSIMAALVTGPSAQLLRVVSQGACMRDLKCRSFARSRDVCMPASHLQLVLDVMQDVENGTL